MTSPSGHSWPPRKSLFGVQVSVTCYEQVVEVVMAAAGLGQGGTATFLPVHGIVMGATHHEFRRRVNQLDLIGPDGQPVRWALNFFQRAELADRVYGPEVMRRVCQRAAEMSFTIYLYGSTTLVLRKLQANLLLWFPRLRIVGIESPPFRPLTEQENDDVCRRMNQSGAHIVFVGLGCPRQEEFAFRNRERIRAVQLCVGAAFDFHAGNKKMAPAALQKFGLEWLFRLTQEPSRLWKRYLWTNSIFMLLVGWHALKLPLRVFQRRPGPSAAEDARGGAA